MYNPRLSSKPLTILQANVAKNATSHELALSLANDSCIDIILIQEPYTFSDISRRITKSHPAYETFTPLDNWETRPRVMSYTRKNAGIRASQLRPVSSRDLLFLQIQSLTGSILTIINIYNAPRGCTNENQAIQTLFDLPSNILNSTLLAGDLNLHHSRWNPFCSSHSNSAESFTIWLDTNSFNFLSTIGEPTHNLGNVLDLVFLSGSYTANTTSAPHLDTTSDHRSLLTTLNWNTRFQDPIQRLRINTLDEKLFSILLTENLLNLNLLALNTTTDLDKLALDITQALQSAYTGSAQRSLGRNTGQPWWNETCRTAVQENRTNNSSESKQNLRKVVKKAKKEFWLSKLDSVKEIKDVFKMTKWHQSAGTYRTPPLVDPLDHSLATTIQTKRDLLINNLLTNTAEVNDIPFDSPSTSIRSIAFPAITIQDIQTAILRTGNTAPGIDEIPTKILQLAWPLIEPYILQLFQKCLEIGHHPKCFRSAIVAIVPKPNKSDRTSPRSYRSIALLSVLGKGLERLIAKKMSWIAITLKVLAKQQFGALPLRSSVDLTTCLTHDVEMALNSGSKATLLTMDIKGAFDAVLPGRLVRRLREQGWPDNLVRWIQSFSTNRSIRIRLDGETGPSTSIGCGLPQGSSISPILFMLYIAPLFWLGNPIRRFGYADDIALVAFSSSLQSNCDQLRSEMLEALNWGKSEGITFDPKKSELIHFFRGSRKGIESPIIHTENLSIMEKPGPLRWLGVYFDRELSFKPHVQVLSTKALTIANAVRSLGRTTRGIPSILLQRAITACVLKKCYFAAETWWPGRTRKRGLNLTISNQVDGHLKLLNKIVLISARAILPVFRTTNTAALYKESNLMPPEIELNLISQSFAARTARLDPKHPSESEPKTS
ncbi:hypothetical protein OCU04_004188 [Sclerotinia nivalis]|uniref:Reverse transcriptase domain-containing protein n=1 Tax=Sclerotinia nivalis TaxID=352851 RepID=A0A9X0APX7_9HELO|nr:hypothetical protein OCU04_004188 [Sclerotinia nivalis]